MLLCEAKLLRPLCSPPLSCESPKTFSFFFFLKNPGGRERGVPYQRISQWRVPPVALVLPGAGAAVCIADLGRATSESVQNWLWGCQRFVFTPHRPKNRKPVFCPPPCCSYNRSSILHAERTREYYTYDNCCIIDAERKFKINVAQIDGTTCATREVGPLLNVGVVHGPHTNLKHGCLKGFRFGSCAAGTILMMLCSM